MSNQNSATVEKDQLWRRRIDQKLLIIDSVYGSTIFYSEYKTTKQTQCMGRNRLLDECFLLSPDEVLAETGGIF